MRNFIAEIVNVQRVPIVAESSQQAAAYAAKLVMAYGEGSRLLSVYPTPASPHESASSEVHEPQR